MARTKSFTPRMQEVFDFLVAFKLEHNGCPPTIKEIVDGTSLKSTSHVASILVRLSEEGLITFLDGRHGRIEINKSVWKMEE